MKITTEIQEQKPHSKWLTITEKSVKIAYWLGKILIEAKEYGWLDWLG